LVPVKECSGIIMVEEGGEDTGGSYWDKVDKEQEALGEGENINAELYLVPVKEYSGTGSWKLPGNVKDVRGEDCDGLQGPRCQLLNQHSHDNGQQLLDLKKSKQDCLGRYISCCNIGNNTRRGHNTSTGSV
jgi:hypothetical protein